MKKILFLMIALVMSVMGAWADALPAGNYTIKVHSTGKYLKPTSNFSTSGAPRVEYSDDAATWEISLGSTSGTNCFGQSGTNRCLNPWNYSNNESPVGTWGSGDGGVSHGGDNEWIVEQVEGKIYTIKSRSKGCYLWYNSSYSNLYFTPTNYGDNCKFVIEKVVTPAAFPEEGTYYLTFKGKDSGRPQYLYHDLSQADGYTLASSTQGTTNAYIWRAECDGTDMTIRNGQGQEVGMRGKHSDGTYTTNMLTYTSHSDCYYLKPKNATGMKSTHNCLNQSNSSDYANAAGTFTVTSWSTTSGPNAADNHWYVTEVTDKDFYDVVITGGAAADGANYSVASYANYNGQLAANGGFFAVAKGTTIEDNDVTVTNVPSGKQAVVTVNDHTINITFETPADQIEVTYTFKVGDEVIGSVNHWETQGGTPTISTIIPSYVNVVSGMPDAVNETAYTIVTSYTGLPFEVGQKCYQLKFGNGNYYIFANNSNTNAKEANSYSDNRDFKWQMGGSWLTGFTFRNLSGYYIAAPNRTPSNSANTTVPTTLTDLCYFDIEENGTNGFRFKPHGGSNYLAHTSWRDLNVQFYNYAVGNAAMQITFTEVERISDAEVAALQAKVDALFDPMSGSIALNRVGYPKMTAATTQAVAGYSENFGTAITRSTYDAAYTALNNLYAETDINLPVDGKAYQISAVHVNADGTIADHYYLYSTAEGQITNSATGNNETYHKFIAKRVGDNVVLVNELGNYLCWFDGNDSNKSYSTKGSNDTYSATHNNLTIEHADTNSANNLASVTALTDLQRFGLVQIKGYQKNKITWQYLVSDHTNSAAQHFVSGNPGDKYYGASSHTFLFQFEEIVNTNKYTLSMPETGKENGLNGKSVGTFSAPYNVELPEGVKAYTASVEAGTVTFNEVEGQVVPKNVGVLLYAENGATYSDKVAVPAVASVNVDDNALRPTTGGDIPEGSYILANGNQGVAFYMINSSERTVAKNKAYLEVHGTQVQKFRFDFEDTVTGISQVSPISYSQPTTFDLAGRRISNAKNGLYIVNGNKVIR